MKKLRLVLADNQPLILTGLREMLADDLRFEIVAAVNTLPDLVARIAQDTPDVVITDILMPSDADHSDGLTLIHYLRRHYPATRILVLTMTADTRLIAAMYAAGAAGVVLKSDALHELQAALECLRLGQIYQRHVIADDAHETAWHDASRTGRGLSPREMEVLRRFAAGQSPTSIAQALQRSIKTVSNQKRSAMRKLNVGNDQELISFCVRSGLFH